MTLLGFVVANAVAIWLLVMFPFAPPQGAVQDVQVAVSLVTRWLPAALALSAALTVLLAAAMPHSAALYWRHAALFLAVPLTTALVRFGNGAPAAFIGAPLMLVVAAIAAQGVVNLWRTREERGDTSIGLLLGLTVLAASLALLPYDRTVQPPQSDEPHYLLAMQSLVRDRDLDLTNDYDGPYPDLYGDRLPDRHVIQAGNAQRPIHDLGLPIFGAIPFALGRRTGVLIAMCFVGAAIAWRGYTLLRTLRFSRGNALLAAATVALVHPVFTYTTQVYAELPAALAMLVIGEQLARPLTPRRAMIVSALCGVMAWLTLRAIFAAAPIGLVLVILAARRRDARLVAAALLPGLLVVGAYALLEGALTGVYLPGAGYFVIRDQQTVVTYAPWIGIPGLLLDRAFGLLSHAPIYGLAAFGAVHLIRRTRATAAGGAPETSHALIALAAGWLVSLIYVGNIRYWWADGSPSSRYIVATLPLLLCAIAAGFERLRSRGSFALTGAAAGWSIAVTFVFALLPGLRYDIANDLAATGSPGALWSHVAFVYRANPGLLFPSMVRAAPQDYALAVAWLFLLGMLAWSGARRAAQPAPQPIP